MDAGLTIFNAQDFNIKLVDQPDYPDDLISISSIENVTPQRLINKLKNEFEITHTLEIKGVRRALQFHENGGISTFLLENPAGITLSEYYRLNEVSLNDTLSIFIDITSIIGKLHDCDIIHKNLNSKIVLINPHNRQINIIDFGISTRWSHIPSFAKNPNKLEGNIYFISPEQTGRINRHVDYRTDYYSLGIMFFEALTGRVPFDFDDPLEVIHAHLAKKIVFPGRTNYPVPPVLKAVVSKLLSKDPDARYVSSLGIVFDLKKCLSELEGKETISSFKIGQFDFSGKLNVKGKLFGRENEIQMLDDAYRRICAGSSELLLVSGYSGVGKSSLVGELQNKVIYRKGHFINGKFDQLQQKQPYHAFILALTDLINIFLAEPPEQLMSWKENILNSIGSIGKVLTNTIPALEYLIGEQPDVPILEGQKAKNRFSYAFRSFFKGLIGADHPLVLFIDDLQWSDNESLELLKSILLDPEMSHLLVICAYRSNELNPSHPVMHILNVLQDEKVPITKIKLGNLSIDHIADFIREAMRPFASPGIQRLTTVIMEKTMGNAYFAKQFLSYLHDRSLITLTQNIRNDKVEGRWEIHFEEIAKAGFGVNMKDLIQQNIKNLPDAIQTNILFAACMGNRFNLDQLSDLRAVPREKILGALRVAVDKSILEPVEHGTGISDAELAEFRFVHDGMQQAAYSMIIDQQKKLFHYKIGCYLLENFKTGRDDVTIFEVVHHLNLGSAQIENRDDKIELLRLNLAAAITSKRSAAFFQAFDLLNKAIQFSTPLLWDEEYLLALDLYSEGADAAFQVGKFQEMHQWGDLVLSQAKSILHCERVYLTKIRFLNAANRTEKTLRTGLEILSKLGVNFPEAPGKIRLILELLYTKILLWNKSKERLLDLPLMTLPEKQFILRILSTIGSAAYMAAPELAALISFKFIQLNLKFGHTEFSPYNFAGYGLILCGYANDIQGGYRFGQLALQLLEKIREKSSFARTHVVVNAFISHWKQDLTSVLQPLEDSHVKGLEAGDHEFATSALGLRNYYAYFSGIPLYTLEVEIKNHLGVIQQLNQTISVHWHKILLQKVQNLIGKTEDGHPAMLIGATYNEVEMLPIHESAGNKSVLFTFFFNKAVLCYLFGEKQQALHYLSRADQYKEALNSSHFMPVYHMYAVLIHFINFNSKKERQQQIKLIKSHLAVLIHWSKFAPKNIKNKVLLVKAVISVVRGNLKKALRLCELSIQNADANKRFQESGLALELAIHVSMSLERRSLAKYFALEAVQAYTKWGAHAKVKGMMEQYADIIGELRISRLFEQPELLPQTTTLQSAHLDLATLLKASMVISKEITLDKLIKKIMAIVMENAGAERAFFILKNKDQMIIHAKIENDKTETFGLNMRLEDVSDIARSVVYFVARTGKVILLKDATDVQQFHADPYIVSAQPKSILCAPIGQKDKIRAIVYLENNLTTRVFLADRLRILDLLSGQAAISIENAYLYEKLEETLNRQVDLIQAYQKFVPHEFLQTLGYESILDASLGDQVEKEVTIFFSDIRSFTFISEHLAPAATFNYLNAFYGVIGPVIQSNMGFVCQFYGDGIMALFMREPADAVDTAIQIQQKLEEFNRQFEIEGISATQVGIGIHTGLLMMGILGDRVHMNTTVVSDAVNTASRIEGLTKIFDARILVSKNTLDKLKRKNTYNFRSLGKVKLKGKQSDVEVFEVFDGKIKVMPEPVKKKFESGLEKYFNQSFTEAAILFGEVLAEYPKDEAASRYLKNCAKYMIEGVTEDWSPTEIMENK